MKFIRFELLGKDGRPGGYYYAVPDKIVGIAPIMVPGDVAGPNGEPVLRTKAGIDLGYKILPVNMTQEEVVEVLVDENAR